MRNINRFKTVRFKLLCAFLTIMFLNSLSAQNVTLNYVNNSVLNSDPQANCNVFKTPAGIPERNINGVNHSPLAGGVRYNSSTGLLMRVTFDATRRYGVGFRLNYNFKPNYVYQVSITTNNGDGIVTLGAQVTNTLTQYQSFNPNDCNTVDLVSYNTTSPGTTSNPSSLLVAVSSASTTHNLPIFKVSSVQNIPYLIIWAYSPMQNKSLTSFNIRSISIVETFCPSLAIPSGLTYNSNTGIVSFGAVTGATFYTARITNLSSTPATQIDFNIASGTQFGISNILPASSQFNVSVQANSGCTTSVASTAIGPNVVPCVKPVISMAYANYVWLYPVLGAQSYDIGFLNMSGQLVYQINNISPNLITNSPGYQYFGVPSGIYRIVARTNCSPGIQSEWSQPYYSEISVYKRNGNAIDLYNGADDVNAISVYPNPATSTVALKNVSEITKSTRLRIFNVSGQEVFSKKIDLLPFNAEARIDIEDFKPGVYYVQIINPNGIVVKRIVKQ